MTDVKEMSKAEIEARFTVLVDEIYKLIDAYAQKTGMTEQEADVTLHSVAECSLILGDESD